MIRRTTLASAIAASLFVVPVGLLATETPKKSLTLNTTKPAEAPLRHIRIRNNNAFALADKLELEGFEVLEGSVAKSQVDAIVTLKELKSLQQRGLNLEVIALGQPFQNHPDAMPLDAVKLDSTALVPPSGYKNLAQVMQELNAIAALNPSIAKLVDITERYNQPTTIDGHHMYAIKISDNVNQTEDEPTSLIVSNHHVRELVTPVIALKAARNLVQQYGTNADVTRAVNDNEIWIAANWNPDGYVHVFTVDNMWRKNRRVMSNGVGVDLNRNYPVGWSTRCSGSTSHSSQTYKGPSAASEVETLTMMAWANDRRFTKVLDFHSSGREILWDYDPDCATHPFDAHQKSEGQIISNDAGYFRWRSATALGENFQWHLNKGANAYLMETHTSFQPSYASAEAEAEQLWPSILNYLNRPIPVVGHATDETGAPMRGVNVMVQGKSYPYDDNNLSGDFGRFHVHLPSGTHTLTFSKDGYQSQTKTVNISSGQTESITVQMQPGNTGDGVIPLDNNVPLDGIAGAKGDKLYYKLEVPADATGLAFRIAGGTGDADLYVRKDSKPTLTEYECRPYVGGNNETCNMRVSEGTWYVMLVGYSSFTNVSLTGNYTKGGNGDDTLNLSNLSASTGEELHYSVTVPSDRTALTATTSGNNGDADLYVKFGSPPTRSDYDCRSYSSNSNESCSVNRKGEKAYIMIHAYSSFSGLNLNAGSN